MNDSRDNAIAVIGIGARVPGAPDARTFLSNLRAGVYSITEVPTARWDPAIFFHPDPSVPDRTYSRIGGFLSDFEAPLRRWRIPPGVAAATDPTQILALEVTQQALEDAGLLEWDFPRSRCAVILGNSMGGDLRDRNMVRLAFALFARALQGSETARQLEERDRRALLEEVEERVLAGHAPITEDTMAGELANVVAGRVAAAYRLTGPSFTVDAACASSLAAVSQAVRSLRTHECDLVITGGVDRNMSVSAYVKFCKTMALSANRSAPFDASADGFVMGEGAGVLVLRRLEDAEREGDRIRAIIRGVGASSDGGGRGITSPSPDGQLQALRRAWTDANLEPSTLGLVEAHGTSTPVGDAAEVETLCRLLGSRANGARPVAVGSVKSNIGHLKSAAGAAGLVKAILSMEERTLFPSLNFSEPNLALRRKDLPIQIQTSLEPWEPKRGTPRRAGVSAFGFGGTNFHVVLEEHGHISSGSALLTGGRAGGSAALPDPSRAQAASLMAMETAHSHADGETAQAPEEHSMKPETDNTTLDTRPLALPGVAVVRLGAPDRRGLSAALRALLGRAGAGETIETIAVEHGRSVQDFPLRAAIVAGDAEELVRRAQELDLYLSTGKGGKRLEAAGVFLGEGPAPRLAFLFPGQGSQYLGMLADLRDSIPEVRDTLAEADGAMADLLEQPLSAYMLATEGTALPEVRLAEPDDAQDAAARALRQTSITQPAMLAADIAILRVLCRLGLRPDEVAGHSLGEYAAAVAAGVLPFEQALRAVAARGREMTNAVPPGADPGKMAVLSAKAESLAPILDSVSGYVVAANINGPHQTVIAGESRAVASALARAEEQGMQGMELPVSHAFHTKVVSAASEPLRAVLSMASVRAPGTVIYSNVTAEPYPRDPEAIVDLLARQVASPVEFWAIVERMYSRGVRTFLEVGPKKALAGLVRDILGERPHRVIHTNHPKKGGPRSLAEAIALLVAEGHPVSSTRLLHGPVDIADPREPGCDRGVTAGSRLSPARSHTAEAVWITGVAAGVPGRERLFDDLGMDALLAGEPLLERLSSGVRQSVVDQRIERLVKSEDGTGALAPVSSVDDVMSWAGRAGALDLQGDYLVGADWDRDRDPTTRMAVAAAYEVLRDGWMPLVEERRPLPGGRSLSTGFRLPSALGRETGVVFASAFPGYERLLALVEARQAGEGFSRTTLLQILGLGHAHVAERLGALGPNLMVNAACASTPAALALGSDWIRAGRCHRVLVIAADNVTSDALLPWIGGGFLALGAATTAPDLEQAAIPFGRTRHGLILGAGAVGILLEGAGAARARGVRPLAELLATRLANSGDHPMRLGPAHIAQEVDALVADITARLGLSRAELAKELVFMSHETFTPARGGSAQAEVDALRRAFGEHARDVLVVNIKGHTGHPMAVGLEDAAAVAGLWRGRFPAVANLLDPDPAFADLTFHRGGAVDRRFALRLAAGFGSQVALAFYQRASGVPDESRVDEPRFRAFLREECGETDPSVVLHSRLLKLRSLTRPEDAQMPDLLSGPAAPIRIVEAALPEAAREDLRDQDTGGMNEPNAAMSTAATPEALTALPEVQDVATPEALTASPEEPLPTIEELVAKLTAVVAARTGYDPAELEPDLELEADLGIDTVKQAEIVAELRAAYGLGRDDSFRLSEHPTLIALARYVEGRLAPSASMPGNAPASRVLGPEHGTSSWALEAATPESLTASPEEQDTATPEALTALPEEQDAATPEALTASPEEKEAATPESLTASPEEPLPTIEELVAKLTAVVAARTGYDPAELEPDLELEADLGIDTVKQAEIVAELRSAYGLGRDDSFRLSEHPTLIALARYVEGRLATGNSTPIRGPDSTGELQPSSDDEDRASLMLRGSVAPISNELGQGFSIQRVAYQVDPLVDSTLEEASGVVLVAGGAAVEAAALASAVGHCRALHLPMDDLLGSDEPVLVEWLRRALGGERLCGAIWRVQAALEERDSHLVGAAFFTLAKALASACPRSPEKSPWPLAWLLTVVEAQPDARTGALLGSGLASHRSASAGAVAGLTRALGREWPGCRARVLAISARETADLHLLGRWLRAEIATEGDVRESLGLGEGRMSLTLGGPLVASPLRFGPSDVVLVTGASGGIGALVARGLRARFGCRLILTGRLSPAQAPPDAPLDRESAKRCLLSSGKRPTPAAVTAVMARWHREQALRSLLVDLEASGDVAYMAADLADPSELAALVRWAARRFGRLDAVIHAAGLQRSRGIEGKTARDFTETFQCKARAAQTLLGEISLAFPSPLRRFVGLGSVAGLLGNAGQTDYASANAALAGLGAALSGRGIPGLTIHFTGWDDVGMTADPDLRRRLVEMGLDLLPSDLGVEAILRLFATDLSGEVAVAGRLGGLAPELAPRDLGPVAATQAGSPTPLRFPLTSDIDWLSEHSLEGTPLLPAVVGLEWMARAAAASCPGRRVVAVENARFDRPLKVHPGRRVEAVVDILPGETGSRAQATLRSERQDHADRLVSQDHFFADLVLAPSEAATPVTSQLEPLDLGPLEHHGPQEAEIYEHLFHTGRFQVLRAVRLWGPKGLVAEASASPFTPGVSSNEDGLTHLVPLAVEAALQAAGMNALLAENAAVLPAAIESLSLHADPREISQQNSWILRVRSLGAAQEDNGFRLHRFDVDLLAEDGAPLLSLRGLDLVERSLVSPRFDPITAQAFDLVEMDLEGLGHTSSRVLDLGAELSPAEERKALSMAHAGRRLEWIAGRLAAKELVRRHLRDRHGLALARERIEIATDPGGAPFALVPSRPGLAALLPAISITHACGRAIALGLPVTGSGVRVGVDLTSLEPRPESFASQWLTPREQRLLDALGTAPERQLRIAELWSLKEAVSKALGLGLALTASELEIAAICQRGNAQVELKGAAAERYSDLGGRLLTASVQPWPGGVLAWARLELGNERGPHPVGPPRPLEGLRESRLHAER
ncbi:MAG: SDR family NAD(P)-dependent oxidoreductase [Polyangia bacterium]|jgi:phosphopantetheine--protein transferase-like protein|nr:SDR family NAD(P)-dependent oxidoreductase [Polyangia bacterium]